MPSYPCGNSSTKPLIRCHLASPLERNWSMTICAPLTKSPNWASHKTKRLGSAELIPYSKPSTASSDSMVLITTKSA